MKGSRLAGRPASASRSAPRRRLRVIPGKLIIRFREQALRAAVPAARAGFRGRSAARALDAIPESVTGPLDFLRDNLGMSSIKPVFGPAPGAASATRGRGMVSRAAVARSVASSEPEDLRGLNIVEVDPARVDRATIRGLQASPAVEYVEQVPARWLAATTVDPNRNFQWGLRAIGWFDAVRPDARQIPVAVLDTGIDARHEDLKSVIASYDKGGFSGTDHVGHGTHVAGIIGAAANNAMGIAGVARCAIHAFKVFSDTPDDGEFYTDGEAYFRALRSAERRGMKVVNLSLGGEEHSRTEATLIRRLVDAGVVVVAAMGNEFEEGNPVEYPGAFPGVIAVGAVGQTLRRASFSNTGKHIHIVAPGVSILSTLPMRPSKYRDPMEHGYFAWDGTSMATPHVAGAVALLLAKRPDLTPAQVRDRLATRAKRIAAMGKKTFTPELGYGLLHLPALLR